jgi:hypothetical protein
VNVQATAQSAAVLWKRALPGPAAALKKSSCRITGRMRLKQAALPPERFHPTRMKLLQKGGVVWTALQNEYMSNMQQMTRTVFELLLC